MPQLAAVCREWRCRSEFFVPARASRSSSGALSDVRASVRFDNIYRSVAFPEQNGNRRAKVSRFSPCERVPWKSSTLAERPVRNYAFFAPCARLNRRPYVCAIAAIFIATPTDFSASHVTQDPPNYARWACKPARSWGKESPRNLRVFCFCFYAKCMPGNFGNELIWHRTQFATCLPSSARLRNLFSHTRQHYFTRAYSLQNAEFRKVCSWNHKRRQRLRFSNVASIEFRN